MIQLDTLTTKNCMKLKAIKMKQLLFLFISIKKGQFKTPTLMKSQPKEFGEGLIEILKSNFEIKTLTLSKMSVEKNGL